MQQERRATVDVGYHEQMIMILEWIFPRALHTSPERTDERDGVASGARKGAFRSSLRRHGALKCHPRPVSFPGDGSHADSLHTTCFICADRSIGRKTEPNASSPWIDKDLRSTKYSSKPSGVPRLLPNGRPSCSPSRPMRDDDGLFRLWTDTLAQRPVDLCSDFCLLEDP